MGGCRDEPARLYNLPIQPPQLDGDAHGGRHGHLPESAENRHTAQRFSQTEFTVK